jgi:hypothetical protein
MLSLAEVQTLALLAFVESILFSAERPPLPFWHLIRAI